MYRTEGSHITIWCNVSGYQGPAEQNFQWSIYLPSAPEREVQIVSTVDSAFPYAIYTQRVRGGKIYVERVQGNSALLHITELQARDAGEYECHTPNTDERYFGSYSAKMNLVGKDVSFHTARVPPAAVGGAGCPNTERGIEGLNDERLFLPVLGVGDGLVGSGRSPCPGSLRPRWVDREWESSPRPLPNGSRPTPEGSSSGHFF